MEKTIKLIFKKFRLLYKKSKKIFLFVGLYLMLLIYLLASVASLTSFDVNELSEQEICIDKVVVLDTYNNRGSRIKLKIMSNSFTYYVWYPRGGYGCYEENITKDLISGNIECVTVKFSDKQSIRDRFTNRIRVVEIRSKDTYYYSVDDEMTATTKDKIETLIVFIILIVIGFSFLYVIFAIV